LQWGKGKGKESGMDHYAFAETMGLAPTASHLNSTNRAVAAQSKAKGIDLDGSPDLHMLKKR